MQKKYLSMAISGAISALIAGVQVSGAIAQEQSAELTEEVLVTGSRIYQPGLDSVTPVQVLNAADLDLGAEVNIGDAINQLPAAGTPLFNRTNSNFDISNSGVVNVNLRDLAAERTLVLVNGRRFVAGVPGSSAVDLNAIPSAMIQRVEITTGGNSAVYGSDAVAGVVNFVTKKNFEGVELSSRYEVTGEGDGEEYDFGLLMGSNFSDEKGNATVFFGYTDQGAVFSRDRERTAVDAVGSYWVLDDGEVFDHYAPYYSSYPPQGRFNVTGTGSSSENYTYRPGPGNGILIDHFDNNGTGDEGIADGFNRMDYRLIAIPTERFLLATNTHYDFNDSVSAFIEGTYTTTKTKSELEPFPMDSYDIFGDANNGGIPLQYENSAGDMISNPYMPQEIYDAATANGLDGVSFVRRLSEFGGRGSENERQTFRTVFGLEGQFADDSWRWDVSYNYGQTTQAQVSQGQVDITAMRYALLSEENPDNPGEIRCVDATAREFGCMPLNVFGFNSASPEAVAYVSADQTRNATVKQKVFQANISGALFEMPAGDLAVATGIESRSESSVARNDALTVRGLNSSNASPNVKGQFDVDEFYAEVNVPLLKDTFVQSASLGLAGRLSDYSTVGTTSTYEGKLDIKVNDNILLRGSAAQAVRAPGVDELYDPGTQTFSQVNDPCNGITAASQGVVADNCRAVPEIAARIEEFGEFTLSQPELQGTTGFLGGNSELYEETANTYTFGFVHTPTYLPDSLSASVSVDYWDIQVDDAIFTVTQNNVADLCYGSASFPNNQFCDQITRYPSTHPYRGALEEVNSGSANVGEISTSGIDVAIDLDYDLQMAFSVPGAISWNLAYTNLNKYKIVNLRGEEPDNERGEIGNAKNKFTSTLRYKLEDLTVQWQMRYIGKSRIEDTDVSNEDCVEYSVECYTDAITYSDMQVRYTLRDIMSGNIELFAGVENMFDQDPPIVSSGFTNSDTGTETVAGVYDAIGRSFYAGFKAKF